MPLQVIEGTWEEIERRKAELIGHQLRVIIKPRGNAAPKAPTIPKAPKPKRLVGYGAFKGILGGTDAF